MLKKIRVTNFHSIGEEQELSMEISPKDILDDSAVELKNDISLNLVSCIIGPNASGKTTILKAISFLFWFVNNAYTTLKSESPIPVIPHKLMQDQPTKIEIEFLNENVSYIYKIEFNSKKVLKESLEKEGLRTPIFELDRTNNSDPIKTHPSIKLNEADEIRFKDRQNVPLFSSLIDTAYLPDIVFFKNFNTNVDHTGSVTTVFGTRLLINISRELHTNGEKRQKLLNFTKDIDLGLSDFKFDKAEIFDKNSEKIEEVPILECVHRTKDKEFALNFFQESNGTQHSFFLYLKCLSILEKGGIACLDEIENGLHLEVIKKIISLFENKETNSNYAQLIFSTHQLPLLNERTKTQIFITEKSANLETEIFRLDDLDGIRNDENYFHKYAAGAYGGTPNINWLGKEKDG